MNYVTQCEPGKVPGWLDENGNPQGCVDNNPTPLAPKDELVFADDVAPAIGGAEAAAETVTETAPPAPYTELALTGADTLTGGLLAAVLVATGLALVIRGKIRTWGGGAR